MIRFCWGGRYTNKLAFLRLLCKTFQENFLRAIPKKIEILFIALKIMNKEKRKMKHNFMEPIEGKKKKRTKENASY